jgi:hypothetical protein
MSFRLPANQKESTDFPILEFVSGAKKNSKLGIEHNCIAVWNVDGQTNTTSQEKNLATGSTFQLCVGLVVRNFTEQSKLALIKNTVLRNVLFAREEVIS